MVPVTIASGPVVIDSISILSARIHAQSTTKPSNVGPSSNKLPGSIVSPWQEIVGLCAVQPGFMRLQLEFDSHDHLVQFIEAQRAALGKLDGRVALFYETGLRMRAADFETLADLGGTSVLHRFYSSLEHTLQMPMNMIISILTTRQRLSTICAVQSQ